MSTVDMFEDGNANMPLDIDSEEESTSNSQLVRQKKRRRRLVFSGEVGGRSAKAECQLGHWRGRMSFGG